MFGSTLHKSAVILVALLAIALGLLAPATWSAQADDARDRPPTLFAETFVDQDGRELAWIVVPGKPPEETAEVTTLPQGLNPKASTTLANVPAFDWSYGCAPTAAAMLFGYYDRTGYSEMYSGPTNSGFCPEDNTIWGQTHYWGKPYSECPLSATHQGIDGRDKRGHVDDYWVNHLSFEVDPYITNGWIEHEHGTCTADYMGTSQSKYEYPDGSTWFAVLKDGTITYDYTEQEPDARDGCHGMRLFAESRGYDVVTNYTQLVYGATEDNPFNGFAFDDYVAQIDAGRPVMIHVLGHAMLGFGYNTSGNVVYLYDTWDHDAHAMTWGGAYDETLHHIAVTVIELEPVATMPPTVTTSAATSAGESEGQPAATLNGVIEHDGGGDCEYRFEYDIDSGEPYSDSTTWTGSKNSGESFSETVSSLDPDTTYYFRAQAKNTVATSSGDEMTFVTPKLYSVTLAASSGNVSLVIDGATYLPHDLPAAFSWPEGSVHECAAPSPVSVGEGTQYVFASWSDGDTSASRTVTVSGDAAYTAEYTTQHYLTVDTDRGDPEGEGWHNEGTDVTIDAAATIGDGDTRFVFSNWTVDGDEHSDSTLTLTMDAPHTAIAGYTTQHFFTVRSERGDEPSGEGWYDEGEKATTGTPEEIVFDEDTDETRYVFSHWVVDEEAQTARIISLNVYAPHAAVAQYETQHYLAVNSDYGDPTGQGWYDEGSVATVSVTSPVGRFVRKVFTGWSGDLTAAASTKTIVMDQPKTVTATWHDDYLYPYLTGAGLVVVLGGASLALALRKGNRPPRRARTH